MPDGQSSGWRILDDRFVRSDLSVTNVNDAVSVLRDVMLVSDEDDGVALRVQIVEQAHDFIAGFGVEITGGLVGQHDGRGIDQCAGDGHALALSAGKLVGLVVHAGDQVDALEGFLGFLDAFFGRRAVVDERKLNVVQRGRARQKLKV